MRRWMRVAVGLAVAVQSLGIWALSAPAANAAAWEDLTTLTADTQPTWQTNGIAWVVETVGNVVYVGGSFTKVRPPGVAEGGAGEVARTNLVAFDATTGDLLPCAPSITLTGGTATVRALDGSPDGSRLYIGGAFSSVDSVGVANLVSLDTATCTLTPWAQFRRPAVTAVVHAISATSDAVYFGGEFLSVEGQTRTRVAAVSSNGTLSSFVATPNATVRAIIAAPEVGKVVVGGDFTSINGSSAQSLVALNPTTGANTQTYPGWLPSNSVVKVLVRDGDTFYVGAEGTGGGVFDGRIAGVLSTGQQLWKDNCLGATQALAAYDGVLYSGSHAHDCSSTPGGYPDGRRRHLLAQSAADMTILPWFPDTDGGLGEALGPRSMVMGGGQLWVVGEFLSVNGVAQQGITRFAAGPDTGYVNAPILSATSSLAGKITVRWQAGWDTDNDKITYQLFRTGTTQPISVQTVRSREWSRPRMSFTDNVGPGVTASYSIRTSDGTNLSPKGPELTITAATSDVPYVGSVSTDAPNIQWRLDETSGTTAADSSGGGRTGSYANVTLNQASALASGNGRSATFNGTSSRVNTVSEDHVIFVDDYSVEVWFRTTSTRGGRLVGYGNSRTGLSSNYDRALYLTNAGNVVFGQYTTTTNTLRSAGTFRDGLWHHAVGTKGAQGMRLYVDGRLAGSNTVTANQSYYGWWNVGGDQLSGWPDQPTSNYFSGSLDEVAIYDKQLTAVRIFDHFQQGQPSGVSDTSSPTTPGTPAISASSSTVTLNWTAATDNMLVAQYRVYRSATPGFTPSDSTLVGNADWATYTDRAVLPGTWYYKVVAVDGVGRTSSASGQGSVTVADTEAPTQPKSLSATAFDDQVDLTWNPSTDDLAITGYDVYRLASSGAAPSADALVGTTLGTAFTDTAVPAGTWYYKVVAKDGAGNQSKVSASAKAVTRAVAPPIDFDAIDGLAPEPAFSSPPLGSTGTGSTIAGASLVSWSDPRFSYLGATGFSAGTVYPDTYYALPSSRYPGTRGSQPVYSVDFVTDASVFEVSTKYINATQQTIQVKVDGRRTTTVPRLVGGTTLGGRLLYKVDFGTTATRKITLETSYFPFGGVFLPSGASLSKSSGTKPVVAVVGDSISGGSAQNTGVGAGTWVLRAADYLGWSNAWNESVGGTGYVATGSSVAIPTRIQDDAVRYQPQRLVLWAGYNDQLLDQASIGSAASSTLGAVRTGSPATRIYVVGPFSPSGTPGTSLLLTDTTLRQAAAAAQVPFISPATGVVYGADGQVVARQRPWISGTGSVAAPVGDGNADSYIGTDKVHPTDVGHAYLARRMAAAINEAMTAEVPLDTTAPSAPSGVTASVAAATVHLTWSASTDNVGVTGYDVFRGDTAGFEPAASNRVASATGVSADDSPGQGSWFYKVVAKDAAGNTSSPGSSGAVQVVIPDTQPPSVPGNVTASVSGSQVTLTWSASTDDRSVDGYEVHRGTAAGFTPSASTLVATTSGPNAMESSVPQGTWFYKVVARDGAGNLSAASVAAQAEVSPPPPTTLTLPVIADTYLNAGQPSTVLGTQSSMIVDATPNQRGLLRFTLPAAPAGQTLTSATLKVRTTYTAFATSPDVVTVRLADDGWGESTTTWNTRTAVSGTTLGTFPAFLANETQYGASLDVAQLTGKTGSVSFALDMTGGDEVQLWTREYGNVSARPVLELVYS